MILLPPTSRLYFEPLAPEHAAFIEQLLNTEGWIKNIGERNVRSHEDALGYIQKISDNPNSTYTVFLSRETRVALGVVTLIKRDNQAHFDIGFAMLPEYERNGYALEASKQQLDYLLASGQHEKIIAIALKDNLRSISLLEKLGLTLEEDYWEGEELMVRMGILI